jgi:hypothetical protein
MPKYVQAPYSDTWHWCSNCSAYPSNPAKREALLAESKRP